MNELTRWVLLSGTTLLVGCSGAGAGESGEALDEAQAPLFYGSTDFSSYPHEGAANVGILTSSQGRCSGILLRNNVVLTARHCVTTNGELNGPLVTDYTGMRANLGGPAANPCNFYGAGMCQNVANVIPAPFDANGASNQDVALLILAGPITVNGDSKNFFSAIDPFSAANYTDTWALTTGNGNDENGNYGFFKQGQQVVTSSYNVSQVSGTNTRFVQLVAQDPSLPGTATAQGDSGGALWNIASGRQHTVIGVHSNGGRSRYAAGYYARAQDFRYQFNKYLSDHYAPTHNYLSLGSMALWEQVWSGGGTAPIWQAVGSTIVEKANSQSQLVLASGIYENVAAGTEVSSTDDDDVGVIARFSDINNYLYCAANRAKHYVRIVARVEGSDSVISSSYWGGNLSTRKSITFYASESYVSCNLAGEAGVEGYQYSLVAGRVGLYNGYNKGAVYYSFGVGPETVNNTTW